MYFVRFILFCIDSTNDFLGKNCPFIAGAISFYMLFSIFPLALVVISVWGFFLGPDVDKAALAEQIAEVIPISSDFMAETMSGVASARTITGIVGVLGLMWTSSTAFAAIRKGINSAWGITRPRPFIRERLIDLTLGAGAGALMVVLLFIPSLLSYAQGLLGIIFPDGDLGFVPSLTSRIASPVIPFAVFLILYKYIPNTEVRFRDVWIFALGAAVAFEATKWGFLEYLRAYSVHNIVYGAVGALMALLAWVYASAMILLIGALAASRYVNLARRAEGEERGLRLMWNGLSRVRIRTVELADAPA